MCNISSLPSKVQLHLSQCTQGQIYYACCIMYKKITFPTLSAQNKFTRWLAKGVTDISTSSQASHYLNYLNNYWSIRLWYFLCSILLFYHKCNLLCSYSQRNKDVCYTLINKEAATVTYDMIMQIVFVWHILAATTCLCSMIQTQF